MNTDLISHEMSYLSSILFNPELIRSTGLLSEDFFFHAHKDVFDAMHRLSNKNIPIDELFLKKELGSKFDETVMLNIMSHNPLANVVHLETLIKEDSLQRTILQEITLTKEKLLQEDNPSKALLELETKISEIKNRKVHRNILRLLDLSTVEEERPVFLLEDILPIQKNEVTIISAKGGSAKSYVAAYALMQLSTIHNLKCFAWFSEDRVGVTKTRINKLSKLYPNLSINNITIEGKETRPFHFINKQLSTDVSFYLMKQQLKEYDVIILDPLIAFFGADENNNSDARYFMNLLNQWCEEDGKSIILIHHHSKGENATARGAGAFVDACRIHYTIEQNKNDDRYRILKLEKTNHYSGKNEFKIQLFEDGNRVHFEKAKKHVHHQNDQYDDF